MTTEYNLLNTTEFNSSLDGWESVSMVGDVDWTWGNNYYYCDEKYAYMNINTTTWSNGYAILKVQASTDNFTTHIEDLWSKTQSIGPQVFGSESINLSEFAGQSNVRIRFLYTGGSAYAWVLDDIKIAINNKPGLKSLSISSGELSPSFQASITDYTVKVVNNVSSIDIHAVAVRPTDIITGTGTKTLNEGDNIFHLLVQAENSSYSNTYTVKIIRSDDTGFDHPDVSSVKAYPNPTTGIIYVENTGGEEVSVYNLPGELLLRTPQNPVDLSRYPQGVYLLQVGSQKVKVIKTK
jgi:hypothetical protein